MAYNPNIPQATDFQDQSQAQMLENFSLLQYASGGMTVFPKITAPTGTANQFKMYNNTTDGNLYLLNGTGTPTNISGKSTASTSSWTYLPSGILVKWGFASGLSVGVTPLVFPTSGSTPVFSVCNFAMLTPSGNTGSTFSVYVSSVSPTQINVAVKTATAAVYWIAFGQ